MWHACVWSLCLAICGLLAISRSSSTTADVVGRPGATKGDAVAAIIYTNDYSFNSTSKACMARIIPLKVSLLIRSHNVVIRNASAPA